MIKNKFILGTVFLCFCVLLSGCQPTYEKGNITSIVAKTDSTPPNGNLIETKSGSDFKSEEASFTKTPMITPDIPRSTNTPKIVLAAPSKTNTPVKFSFEETNQEILNNFSENGNCKLPCFWGITVGESNWKMVEQKFSSYDLMAEVSKQNFKKNGNKYLDYGYGYKFINKDEYVSWFLTVIDDTVTIINIGTNNPSQFGLSSLFNEIGNPEKIFILTAKDASGYPQFEPYLEFSLILYYEKLNMIVEYFLEAQNDSQNIVGCFEHQKIRVWIWAQHPAYNDYEDYVRGITAIGNGNLYAKELHTVTDFTIPGFVEFYKDQENRDRCIKTPVNNW